jgi:serine/threonine protein kinase
VSDEQAARKVAKGLLQAVKGLHDRGVIHRDVKPNNVLLVGSGGGMFGGFGGGGSGKLKLIDLGGAADLRTGANYDESETVFDPTYGPPERYISGNKFGGLLGGLGWAKDKPDLFDAFSCGMTILQVSCPSMRKKGGMNGVRKELKTWAYDCEAWRASLPERRQSDFAILDANGGAGWKLVCGLVAQKSKRITVAKALSSPFCR